MADNKGKQRVYILDDSDDFRESTMWLLEAMDYEVHGFAAPEPAIEALINIDKKIEAVLLLDIRMPIMSGLDVHDELNRNGFALPVIYMTAHGDVPIAVSAMSKGALTFLEKPLDEEGLQRALTAAFSEAIQIRRGMKQAAGENEKIRESIGKLTPREAQVVQGLLGGLNNQQIADDFNISIKTVELYRSKVMKKLGAKNAAQLVRMVMSCEPV